MIIVNYGVWTYGILFLIIFLETGLVVTPFLPGDSLLFAAGTFSANTLLSPYWLFFLLSLAAIAGDTVNYWIGHYLGLKAADYPRLIKPEHLARSRRFYEKHGNKTIIIARFVPIVRTFAPFLAGASRMHYGRFITYNIVGGVGWVAIFVFGGHFLGNLPVVKENFTLAIFIIIFISFLPGIVDFLKHLWLNKKNNSVL